MKPSFLQMMGEATRLTRGGNLLGATAAIQAALGGTAAVAEPVEVVAETPPLVARVPSAGGQFIAGSHSEAGLTREYKLYLPPGAASASARPLIVMLHGCSQNPDDFAAGTGMNEAALAQGFAVLYPAQAQEANPARCWNWFKHNHQQAGRGEPAVLAGMTRAVMQRHSIDPQRVFVAGLSAGGAMAAILGDAYPELFAAVGVHSGLPTGAASDMPQAFAAMKNGGAAVARSGRTPPTIVFHGDQDGTVSPINGEHAVQASAGAARAGTERGRSRQGRDYTRRVFRAADGQPRAEHWLVHGAGHAWSGGRAAGSYTDPSGPDASAEMLRFFFAHPLATA